MVKSGHCTVLEVAIVYLVMHIEYAHKIITSKYTTSKPINVPIPVSLGR